MISSSPSPGSATGLLWLLVAALFSLVVALVAGMVKTRDGAKLSEAVLTGGAAYATCMGLCLGILAAAGAL